MEEFIKAPDAGLNTSTSPSESSEVTQEDLIRVSESMKQAALVGGQIRWDQQKNRELAKFLEFLFNEVKSDQVRADVVELCTVPDGSGKNLTLSLQEVVAFFLPFFQQEAEQHGVFAMFPTLPHLEWLWQDTYLAYIKMLRQHLPLFEKMDITRLESTLKDILQYFGYTNPEKPISLE